MEVQEHIETLDFPSASEIQKDKSGAVKIRTRACGTGSIRITAQIIPYRKKLDGKESGLQTELTGQDPLHGGVLAKTLLDEYARKNRLEPTNGKLLVRLGCGHCLAVTAVEKLPYQ